MNLSNLTKITAVSLAVLFAGCSVQPENSALKRVYKDVKVGEYQASLHLDDCNGTTFLQCMKDLIYPAIAAESENRTSGKHIDGIAQGEGVELRLTDDVSTYHVKYKRHGEDKAERSGRSFSAVGENGDGTVEYVADASYAHYFDSFERSLGYDKTFLKDFYTAIFNVLTRSDASHFSTLNKYQKRLATDFIAVYVAEQYRHLLGGKGERLGRSHPWDNALLHTTMLIAFHAGQSEMHMYYQGEFTDKTYNQYDEVNGEDFCAYKNWNDPRRDEVTRRKMQLRDYWQPNKTCDRSGVNITRRDFEKMGTAISTWQLENSDSTETSDMMDTFTETRSDLDSSNMYKNIANFFISNDAPDSLDGSGDEVVEGIVDFLMISFERADEITDSLIGD